MFEAFQFGPFLFRTHLLFLLLGAWLTSELFLRLAIQEGLQITHFLRNAFWYLIAFLVGGRLFALLLLYRVYLQDPFRILIVWDGVFSFLGACIGVGIAIFVFTWRDQSTFLQWLDVLLPCVSLGLAFDWLGRFLGALSYGKPTDVPWGIVHESMSVRYTVPVHPVQLYYAFFFLILTVLLLSVRKREKRRAGLVTLVGIISSSLGIIVLDVFRGDFAITVFAKLSDFIFLGSLFISLGVIAVLETKISHRNSLLNSSFVCLATIAYLLIRPWISIMTIEWRFSQFLAVLAILATTVYVVVHRWKYPHL